MIKAQKKYYEKIKTNDDYKQKQTNTSLSYYKRNRDAINAKRKMKYRQKKDAEANALNSSVDN